jgi:hypothetical protein
MSKVYQCITGNWLHNSKKIFDNIQDAKDHIKMILDMKPEWVSNYEALSSVRITMIDTKELPEYRKIFKEFAGIKPPKTPQINRIRANATNLASDQVDEPRATRAKGRPKKSIVEPVIEPK